mmetsp:Transcript_19228/g.27382  ORF Transcript_19228/g.27382 Transcript_19228/m.27382 type:complete len:472 (+) Transcript_19228:91-1506(+)
MCRSRSSIGSKCRPSSILHQSYVSRKLVLALLVLFLDAATHAFRLHVVVTTPKALYASSNNDNTEAAFAAFAQSLEEEQEDSTFDSSKEDNPSTSSWQTSLDRLLDPNTSSAKRQILLSDLLGANAQIRESVVEALRERKIDPILTPTGKKLQDGTRAVARQITMDILPAIAESLRAPERQQRKLAEELPLVVPKIGERIFDALSTQARKKLEQLQQDLANPTRIPDRISKQTSDILMEARNVFRETPEGLVEPKYKLISSSNGYEIREYDGYAAASTSMVKVGEKFSLDDIASGGAAFNAIAAYIFGANEDQRTMKMTTPVTTTSAGEMRFFLADGAEVDLLPQPLAQEASINEKGAVKLLQVPPARLAIARFTGFVTDGEVSRQKDALLNALALDGVEIDVPHGKPVPYFIFQYNPPYTIPIVRRNEIAIPVRAPQAGPTDLKEEWVGDVVASSDDEENMLDYAPSDVE